MITRRFVIPCTLVLCIVDAFLTIYGVSKYDWYELNPAMRSLIDTNVLMFLFIKIASSALFLSWLDAYAYHNWAKVGSLICLAAYIWVTITHVFILGGF